MDAQIGSSVRLDFGRDHREVEGVFVGSVAPSFIIIRLPKDLKGLVIKEGQALAATYISSGVQYKIKTGILDFVKKYDLLLLSYPEAYEVSVLRKEDRINCHIPATASIEKSALKGLVTDISNNGCQFVVKIPTTFKLYRVSVLTDINLSLSIFGQTPDPTYIKGKVRNTSVDEFKIVLGIEFEKLEEQISRKLKSFIENLKEVQ